MSLTNVTGLLGGLALFLYGMQMMSSGLEDAAGNRMKQILEKLTANRLLGVLVGAVITAVIQSSSATTVMVVGFVNSGMMTLNQAVWIIMGANIGTTITGQLIALDIGAIAPLIAFVGVAMVVFTKKEKLHYIGSIFAGLGVLFIGMDMMSAAMKPLANSQEFISLLSKFENPLLGIVAGLVFTAVIQSSSASVGILQALANSGVIGLSASAFVLFGQNIGTCVTALLASIGTSCNAKRTTVIHITFNVIGTILFTMLCIVTPLISFIEGWTPGNPSAQIANLHTTFNVVTTLVLLPIGTLLPKFATFLLRERADQTDSLTEHRLVHISHINPDRLGASAMNMEGTKKELLRMLHMARENTLASFDVFAGCDVDMLGDIEHKENYIDYLNKEISKYITTAMTHEHTRDGSCVFSSYYSITSNIERIGDHALNIAGYSRMIKEKGIQFSEMAQKEIAEMQKTCEVLFSSLLELEKNPDDMISWHAQIARMEQKIDDLTIRYRNNMFERIQKGTCSDEGSILFSEMLTDFERVGDHALNISDDIMKIVMIEG